MPLPIEQHVWLPHDQYAWVPASIVQSTASQTTFQYSVPHPDAATTQETLSLETARLSPALLEAASVATLTSPPANLVMLDECNHGSVLHSLRSRYYNDEIYTNIGNILISVNPYKLLPIYSSSTVAEYSSLPPCTLNSSHVKPHVFAIAAQAYAAMMETNTGQAIIISGESGSGKTEATKTVLQYLSTVASDSSNSPTSENTNDNETVRQQSVEEEILHSNPLLEAFGNSKTLRNNNSSRFGKWMEIHFSSSGKICSARIVNYLLEKSRVTNVTTDERNYHIFYQVLAGLDDATKQRLKLGTASDYVYTNMSKQLTIAGVNDAKMWQQTLKAMQNLHFSEDEIENIISILAAILQLGNVEFSEKRMESADGCIVVNFSLIEAICNNLKLNQADLVSALTFRTVTIRNETSLIPLTVREAKDGRGAFCRTLYNTLFEWLIKRINMTLSRETDKLETMNKRSIGILDIFGFEIFDNNSFEQFCINWANEKLQQNFNTFIFKYEQEEYKREGIDAKSVTFFDNIECIECIEKKPYGVIAALEEENRLPSGSDESLQLRLTQNLFTNKATKNPSFDIVRKKPNIFVIKHYAGAVEYNSTGMMNKNKDKFSDRLQNILMLCPIKIVKEMMEDKLASETTFLENISVTANVKSTMATMGRGKKITTLGGKFEVQLNTLMEYLQACQPHYIRCVKPNSLKTPLKFDDRMIYSQLNYAGLFQVIQIRQSGFTFRKTYDDFYKEYQLFLTAAEKKSVVESSPTKRCEFLLQTIHSKYCPLDLTDIQFGKTKLFMRSIQRIKLDTEKEKILVRNITKIQSVARGFVSRKKLVRLKAFNKECIQALKEFTNETKAILQRFIAEADENGFDLFILNSIRERVSLFEEYERVESLLVDAKSKLLITLYISSLEAFDRFVKKIPKEFVIKPEILAVKEEVKAARLEAEKSEKCKTELINSLMKEDVDAILKAMKMCEDCKLSCNEYDQAKEFVANNSVAMEKFENVRLAVESNSITAIEDNLQDLPSCKALNEQRRRILESARQALHSFYCIQIPQIIEEDDEFTLRRSIMPKLERLQFMDLIMTAQKWLDQQNELRRAEKERRLTSGEMSAQQIPNVDANGNYPTSEINNDIAAKWEIENRLHEEEKNRRMNLMMQLNRKKQIREGTEVDNGESNMPLYQVNEHEAELVEEFFPPALPDDASTREKAIEVALHDQNLPLLLDLLAQADRLQFDSPIIRSAHMQARLLQRKFQLLKSLDECLDFGNLDPMHGLMSEAQTLSLLDHPTVECCRCLIYEKSERERIDYKLVQAMKHNNIEFLLSLLTAAMDENYESEAITQARQVLMQLGKADDWNTHIRQLTPGTLGGTLSPKSTLSTAPENSPETTDNRTLLEEKYKFFLSMRSLTSSDMSPLTTVPCIRGLGDYAKHHYLTKTSVKESMCIWQLNDLPRSLVQFSTTGYLADKKKLKLLKIMALNNFKHIRGYMGDSFHPYPISLAYEVILLGFNEPNIRDEIYCQLIKQTTQNPSASSLLLGLKLLYLCISTFPPSAYVAPALLAHLSIFADTTFPSGKLLFNSIEDVATQCFFAYVGMSEHQFSNSEESILTERGVMPSMLDIERITDGTLLQPADELGDIQIVDMTKCDTTAASSDEKTGSLLPLLQNGNSGTLTLSPSTCKFVPLTPISPASPFGNILARKSAGI